MLVEVLLSVATIVTGVSIGKPAGWAVLGLGILALLATAGVHFGVR